MDEGTFCANVTKDSSCDATGDEAERQFKLLYRAEGGLKPTLFGQRGSISRVTEVIDWGHWTSVAILETSAVWLMPLRCSS